MLPHYSYPPRKTNLIGRPNCHRIKSWPFTGTVEVIAEPTKLETNALTRIALLPFAGNFTANSWELRPFEAVRLPESGSSVITGRGRALLVSVPASNIGEGAVKSQQESSAISTSRAELAQVLPNSGLSISVREVDTGWLHTTNYANVDRVVFCLDGALRGTVNHPAGEFLIDPDNALYVPAGAPLGLVSATPHAILCVVSEGRPLNLTSGFPPGWDEQARRD